MSKFVLSSSLLSPYMRHYKNAVDSVCNLKKFEIEQIEITDRIDAIKKKFKKAIGYICVLAYSYGYQPDGNDKPSLIEIECNLALENKIPIIYMVIDSKVIWEVRDGGIQKEMLYGLLNKLARVIGEPFIYQNEDQIYNFLYDNLNIENLPKYMPISITPISGNSNFLFDKNSKYHTIFISYKREDWDNYASIITSKLIANGIPVWVDQKILNIGMIWMQEIEIALEKCSHMILCVSPESLASRYVKMEYSYFLDKNKPIYPIICRNAILPPLLNNIQSGNFQELDSIIEFIKFQLHKKQQ